MCNLAFLLPSSPWQGSLTFGFSFSVNIFLKFIFYCTFKTHNVVHLLDISFIDYGLSPYLECKRQVGAGSLSATF